MNRLFRILNSNFLLIILIPLLLSLFLIFNKPAYQQQYPKDYDLQVLPIVLQYLNKYYVDDTKIDPNQMLVDGLNKLESTLDEVLVIFPEAESSADFTIQVNNNTKEYSDLEIYDLEIVGDVMQDVFTFVVPHLKNDQIETIDIEYAVTDKMLKTLDQHSGIITPDVYKEFMIETEGSFGGLGIVIGVREGQLTVISPIEGTPAYKAGIKPNDRIVQIENESTINMSLIEAVSKLRGKKGTDVKIFIIRDTFTDAKEYRITRDLIKIESVEDFSLDNGILYLRIRDFQKNTLNSLSKAIEDRGDDITGIILDLRGNPGGLLDQAEKVSDLFLTNGTVVTTKVGNSQKSYYAKLGQTEYEGKVVVLVDSGSASASEIVAGALKNNQRAIIIGEQTFGKGSVQQIFDLRDGSALKLTIASYLTPGDISIQDVGITPDIKVEPAIISEEDIIYNGVDELKEDETEKPEELPIYKLKYLETLHTPEEEETPEEALTKEERKQKLNEDFSVLLAKSIIQSSNNINREEILDTSKQIIADFSSKEENKIELKWNELGINWSDGNGQNSKPDLLFEINPLKPKLVAGEKSSLSVSVKNNSNKPVHRLRAVTVSDNPIFNGKELIFGKLIPGESRSWNIKFDIPKWVNTRNDKVDLKFFQSDDVEIQEYSFDITTVGNNKPIFAYNFEIIDDGRYQSNGNGSSTPDDGEHLSLAFNIKNVGTGKSDKTIVTLKNLSGDSVYLEKGRFEFTDFEPDTTKTAPFLFKVNKKDINEINFELDIIDEVFREVMVSKIDISGLNNIEKFAKSGGSVVVVGETVPIRGGGIDNPPIIAYTSKGSEFDLLGYNERFAKIKVGTGNTGWILKKDVTINQNPKTAEAESTYNEVYYSQPKINVVTTPLTTNKEEITISGFVVDNDKIENISVFKGEDKVKLLTPNNNSQEFSFKLKLDDGINVFNIIAKDSQGLFSKQTVTIRKSDLS
ncbi:MAG: MXAN_5808 family serine peptidase [Thermodesulfobacteriota bacterium]